MNCSECDSDTDKLVEVVYTDDAAETIALCEDCQDEFADAELINRVEVAEGE
ncbi:hypothetical protein HWV07_15185 [Natronomonas salina]|uniref:hypothetical protein n=1 Tax=Natronomonas salina TaxID=1710540 RepID=UPI0015B78337|nr:hypothetical protein [Natronomonas salina]QLD90305.1 hypothetical protein HWV07_15185 [Natronomonas salina]